MPVNGRRLLFTGGTQSARDLGTIRECGLDVDVQPPDLDERRLAAALRGKDAYILGGVEQATAAVLEQASDLKVLAFLGVGYHAFVDIEAATSRGIAVTNAPGANARAVAEFTVALMLDAARRVTYLVNQTKEGRWQEMRSRNLKGRTLGIVGMGTIGRLVAGIVARGLEMDIVYWSRRRKTDLEKALGAIFLSLDELVACSDVITLHVAYGPETAGLLGADRLAHVRPGAILVNTSEAELVDPGALCNALLDGRLMSVAMDGYYVEPVPSPEADPYGLLRLPDDRFIVTPHTANSTDESLEAMLTANLTSIVNLLMRGDDERVVNPGFREAASWLASGAP